MKYLKTDNGNIKIGPSGNPLVRNEDGSTIEIDAIGANAKITSITAESNQRRKDLSEAKAQLEAFSGIEDPTAALSALQKVSTFDKDLNTQLDNLKNTINATWTEKETAWNDEKKSLEDSLFAETVTSKFATSDVVKQTVLTPDIAATFFGKHFNKDGSATDSAGNPIYSKTSPGEPAKFDEALSILIDTYPNKDSILKGSGANGSGSHKSGPGDGAGGGEALTGTQKIAGALKGSL